MKLKDAVDRIYLKYDSNHSGSLEANEAMPAFNELLVLNSSECMELLKLVDRDKNGRIEKPEFFACMKNLASRQF
jgi:Ca2+-binding EF-hand superfamily protein